MNACCPRHYARWGRCQFKVKHDPCAQAQKLLRDTQVTPSQIHAYIMKRMEEVSVAAMKLQRPRLARSIYTFAQALKPDVLDMDARHLLQAVHVMVMSIEQDMEDEPWHCEVDPEVFAAGEGW